MTKPPTGYQALRAGRVSAAGQWYFLTKVTQHRIHPEWTPQEQYARGPLLQPGVPEILLQSLTWLQEEQFLTLMTYCIMPDHLHLLCVLSSKASLSSMMQRFSSFTSRQIHDQTGVASIWYSGFHEHAIRDESEAEQIESYILANPVAAGLVESAESWPWSSAYQTNPEE